MQRLTHIKSFLVIQTAFIGDVVLATSLVENLRAAYPEADIDFLLRNGNQNLLVGHPHIREILVFDKKKDKYRNVWALWKKIRQRKYGAVINTQRFAVSGFLAAFSGAGHVAGFDKNPFSSLFDTCAKHVLGGGMHEISRNHRLLDALVDAPVSKPVLYPSAADFAQTDKYKRDGPYICIAPASRWQTKQFPAESWADFLRALEGFGLRAYLLGGPEDGKLSDEIMSQCPNTDVINLSGKLSFLQSAALMKDALMNYVNDSAPMHIASAVNAPVTAVYCSTVPDFGFGPLSDRSFIVETQERLSCRPCGIHGRRACPKGHFACGRGIRAVQLMGGIL